VGHVSLDEGKRDCTNIAILTSIIQKQYSLLSKHGLVVNLSEKEGNVINELTKGVSREHVPRYTSREKFQCIKLVLNGHTSAKKAPDVVKLLLRVQHAPCAESVRRWLFATDAMHKIQLREYVLSSQSFSLKIDGADTMSKIKVYGPGSNIKFKNRPPKSI